MGGSIIMGITEQTISEILGKMEKHLSKNQLMILDQTLISEFINKEIKLQNNEVVLYDGESDQIISQFLAVKSINGCSDKTINTYSFHLHKYLQYVNKPILKVTANDIRGFLAIYKQQRKVSNVTLNNMRRSLSSFYGFLHDEGYISSNPMKQIQSIKTKKVIKKPFTDEDLEKLRVNCKNERDLAIVDFLYSTGVRVSEMVSLNIEQIDFIQKECIVFGKGSKERIVYINAKSYIHLMQYLKSRTDDNPALFVSLRKPYGRLSKEGVEAMLRNLGKISGVPETHPHRFRRTCATNALNKGMPIQEVKQMLGHAKTDTTMLYCDVSQENIKLSHKKYIS